jgi:uncharacterized protein YecT (DUF1311 family)
MKNITLIILVFLLSNIGFAQTQLQLNQNAKNKYVKVDKELNKVYKQILKEYSEDANFIKNLKYSQKIWIQFRDAEMKVKYPETDSSYYGSIFPVCWNNTLTELTKKRIKELSIWLIGIEEGDTCSGSIKTK